MRMLIALVALIVVACTPAPAPTPAQPATPTVEAPPIATPAADEATACSSKGGAWQPICRMQTLACVMTFTDAGRACTDGDDCSGDCLAAPTAEFGADGEAATGICASNDDPCGCKQKIEDGKATAAICVD